MASPALADAVAATANSPINCLTTDELLQLVLGDLPNDRRQSALQHVETCPECQLLVGEAARALRDTGTEPARPVGVAFAAGDTVAERYRVERFIARGGMGEVYAVHDAVLDERVALKTLRGASPGDVKAVRRLKTEAQLSRRIGHPNTCRIYEFGEHALAGRSVVYFFTMGLVEGETLGAQLRRDGAFDASVVITIARQLLGGIAEAHSLGILHRDLKSDNIMLRLPPTPGLIVDAVIMDFGLALRLDSEDRLTTDSHAIIGSAAYMAPEQVQGEKLTPATDIYAFGVILFEMLTGALPFRAGTSAATALQRLHQSAPAPSSIDPKLDPAWDRLVLRCLERSVARRFASAREVLAALDGLPTAPLAPPSRRRRRRLVAVVAALVGIALAWARLRPWLAQESPPPALANDPGTVSAPARPAREPEPRPEPAPGAQASTPSTASERSLQLGAKRGSDSAPRASRAHLQRRPLPRALPRPAAAPVVASPVPSHPTPASPVEDHEAPVGPLPIDVEYPQ